MNNLLCIPMYEKDEHGHIIPNLLFHRTFDKLHSRCIEYPFAASNIGNAKIILDVGSAKADKLWVSWLDSLNIDVYATDYDELTYPVKNIKFYKSDIRKLDFCTNTFDKIIAVSVIEHIGLDRPQVLNKKKPRIEHDGDVQAFKELLRVLKGGGEIIMTVPFGIHDGLILGNEARNYAENSIKKFSSLAEPILLEYYEYQHKEYNKIFHEDQNLFSKMRSKLIVSINKKDKNAVVSKESNFNGAVTWRCIPRYKTKAKNYYHVEGVLCGIYRKNADT